MSHRIVVFRLTVAKRICKYNNTTFNFICYHATIGGGRQKRKRKGEIPFSGTLVWDINLNPPLSAVEVVDMESAYDQRELSVQRNYEDRCCKLDSAKQSPIKIVNQHSPSTIFLNLRGAVRAAPIGILNLLSKRIDLPARPAADYEWFVEHVKYRSEGRDASPSFSSNRLIRGSVSERYNPLQTGVRPSR